MTATLRVPRVRDRAELSSRIGVPDRRRRLQLTLGVLWLLDAALQYQPYMFTKDFAREIIAPSAAGNPAVIADPITWSAGVIGDHPIVCNAIFATIQLVLGIGLLRRRTATIALAGSIAWAAGIWWIGEGLGGILTGTADPLMGAPGAALLYVFVTVLAWPSPAAARGGSVATSGPLGRGLPVLLWAGLWGSLAGFALQPANRSPHALSQMLTDGMADEPRWIRAINTYVAGGLAGHGLAVSIGTAVLCGSVAGAIAFTRLTRAAVVLAMILGASFWILGDFGGVLTGTGTDPDTGPLLILLAAAFWPFAPAP